MTGTVFNIQPYSLHDGPGIRTVVFLKGCPLRCPWCSNPESQKREPEVYFDKSKCIAGMGCGLCGGLCENTVKLSNGAAYAQLCPSNAINIYGREMTVEEIIDRVESESVFYGDDGGITLSGGEPFMQPEFATELLREAKHRRINTAVETCGCCDMNDLREAARYLDHILYDIKCTDPHKHKKFTGRDNALILKNIKMLFREFPDVTKLIRTPVIPGFNDSEEDIKAIAEFLKEYKNYRYELLPYHRFGEGKYEMLGRRYADIPQRLNDELFERLKQYELEL